MTTTTAAGAFAPGSPSAWYTASWAGLWVALSSHECGWANTALLCVEALVTLSNPLCPLETGFAGLAGRDYDTAIRHDTSATAL